MGKVTEIAWCNHTFNPWRGCTKISPGCTNCYADAQSKRNPATLGVWGPNGKRVVAAEATWREPLKWNREAQKAGVRRRVFCASLADVFEDWEGPMVDARGRKLLRVTNSSESHWEAESDDARPLGLAREVTMQDVRRRLFALIDETPQLDWLLLTKRPKNVLQMWPAGEASLHKENYEEGRSLAYRANVWLGVSVENQEAADARIPVLLNTPAAVRFLSCEPLLGAVDLTHVANSAGEQYGIRDRVIDWVIVGGESGPGARPMHHDWVRSIRDQCTAAGVPFFFKQWGEFRMIDGAHYWKHPVATGIGEWQSAMERIGKKAAGRMLDGREWSDFPRATCSPS